MSLIRAASNVTVGYALAVVTQIVTFPWFGLKASLGENVALGLVFTAVSLIRGYALRRMFTQFELKRKRTSRSWS